MNRSWIEPYAIVLATLASSHVLGADFSISGFGTLGYARSDQPYNYQRFINDSGTFKRDSVAGIQLDVTFADRLGVTMQIKAAPDTDSDHGYEGAVAWAFLSYRPSNDWLFRAGKQRIPLYLYSESYDVGATYDFSRLPTEMYSISPSNDFTGFSVSKNWSLDQGDVALDAFLGSSNMDVRIWLRDNFPPLHSSGALYRKLELGGGGVGLTYRRKEDAYRIGLGRVTINQRNGTSIPVTFPFVSLFPGTGYYQVDPSLPGPGIPSIRRFNYATLTIGADIDVGSGWRAVGEGARSFVSQTDVSTQSTRGYISVLKRLDKWTPYAVYAVLRSRSGPLNLHRDVNYTTVPGFVPGATLINASQRVGADGILAFDQRSVALGTSYSLSTTRKIKAEIIRTRIGQVSSLVDGPPGSNIRNQNIHAFSVSYNFVF